MKPVHALLAFLLLSIAATSHAQDSVLFVGGAPLDTYQPRVIVALLTEAFQRNDIDFRAEHYPSPRALLMSDSGKADGELHRVYEFHEVSQGKYPNLVRIESQLMTIHISVFSATNPDPIHHWEQLKGARLGYLRGRQNVEDKLTAFQAEIAPQSTETGLFKMLSQNRLDYAISESFQGQIMIATNPTLGNVKEVGRLEETRIYAYMNKKHGALGRRIAETLEAMKRDGSFQDITDRVRQEMIQEVRSAKE